MLVSFREYVRDRFYVAKSNSWAEDFWLNIWKILDYIIESPKYK